MISFCYLTLTKLMLLKGNQFEFKSKTFKALTKKYEGYIIHTLQK